MWFSISVSLLLLNLGLAAQIPQYKGYKVYETTPRTEEHALFLYDLSISSPQFDFWVLARSANSSAYIMVSPVHDAELEDTLVRAGLQYEILDFDLSQTISANPRGGSRDIDFSRYYRHGEINDYLDSLAGKYPKRIKVRTVGHSYENRLIKTITITNGDGNKDKSVVFIDAGIHGREWLAPAAALYVIQQLAENFEKHQQLLEDFDWIILPVVNPDGYEFTHNSDRYWSKTRQPNRFCIGTDANRNFDIHWAEDGTSESGCHNAFHGAKPFSEPETQVLQDILDSLNGRAKLYLSLHAFGSYLLYPWGYTNELPSTWQELQEVCVAGAKAIEDATGRVYTIGSYTNVLYPAAGGSVDYAYAKAGVPVAISVELPFGGSGFDPTLEEMKTILKETWIGIKAMWEKVDVTKPPKTT